jgi:hypothetical protein
MWIEAQVHADDCKDKADRVIKAGTIEALKTNIVRLRSEVRKGEQEEFAKRKAAVRPRRVTDEAIFARRQPGCGMSRRRWRRARFRKT